jgi:hypothetical protein
LTSNGYYTRSKFDEISYSYPIAAKIRIIPLIYSLSTDVPSTKQGLDKRTGSEAPQYSQELTLTLQTCAEEKRVRVRQM